VDILARLRVERRKEEIKEMGELVRILDVGIPLAVVLDVRMLECLGDPLFDVG